jgi:2-succinyl-6-hydroxy-2,4-cyclohexadiene-1-carboxylate synthase
MGGRRLLQAARAPAILLSTHPGLATQQEKAARLQSDTVLAQRLRTEPLDQFLETWYGQELFAPLREQKQLFQEMLLRRKNQDPFLLAQTLLRYSLAHDSRPDSFENYLFVYGGKDLKFGELYRTLPSSAHVKKIEQAGHALHLENPIACATLIKEFVHEYTLRNV